jgi:hypothetical protein
LYFFNLWFTFVIMIWVGQCCSLSLNSNAFTLNVEASYTLANVTFGGICGYASWKTCYIKISMTNVEW